MYRVLTGTIDPPANTSAVVEDEVRQVAASVRSTCEPSARIPVAVIDAVAAGSSSGDPTSAIVIRSSACGSVVTSSVALLHSIGRYPRAGPVSVTWVGLSGHGSPSRGITSA